MKRVAILGSTGSIGVSTLQVMERLKEEFRVFALTGGKNVHRLVSQALKYRPKILAVGEPSLLRELRKELPRETRLVSGVEGMVEISGHPDVDIVVNGLVGSVGLYPTLEAIQKRKRVALANKETIVAFGEIVMKEIERSGAELIPVDSEPSAIFQCLNCRGVLQYAPTEVKRILLTASGGPFLKRKSFKNITVEEALHHPTWMMGRKITIDSATLMNKGFEVIEAHWLFNLSPTQIDILIHPHSIVHSLVEFQDGSLLAQMGVPDMRLPIQYALTYPRRLPSPVKTLDLALVNELKFYSPEKRKFPCIQLAYQAIEKGGTYPSVLSAADEVVVESFLKQRIHFLQIPEILGQVLKRHRPPETAHPTLKEILKADEWAREEARKMIERKGRELHTPFHRQR